MRCGKLILLFLFVVVFQIVGAVTIESGAVLLSSSSGGTVTFSFDINVTKVVVDANYVYLEGVSYTRNGVSYSCNVNHSLSTTIDSATFCVTSSSVSDSSSEDTSSSTSTSPTFSPTETQLKESYTQFVRKDYRVRIDEKKTVVVKNVDTQNSKIIVSVGEDEYETAVGWDAVKIDTNSDGYYDLEISVSQVTGFGSAEMTFKTIYEKIPSEKGEEQQGGVKDFIENDIVKNKKWIPVAVLVVILILAWLWMRKR